MTKIVHLTSAHPRYDQRILWRECCSLREHGYDVALIINDGQENETLGNGIRIISTGVIPKGRIQRMTKGVKHVFDLGMAEDADIYHLHDPELLRIALNLKRNGKKVIFDSHEIYAEQIRAKKYIPRLLRYFVAAMYYFYESFVCKQINGVVDTAASYEGHETFEGRCRRFVYVGNFPRQGEYEGIFIPRYAKRNGICYSGSISEDRGVKNLIKAAGIIGKKVFLAGKFSSEAYREEIMQQDPCGVVSYLGNIIERRKVFELYANCAIGAALLFDEGQYNRFRDLPTKVYEYMAMELPTIISDCPYNRELIEKYHFGLVANAYDVDDIAAKIRWILDHPQEAEKMGKNGKRLLEEQFTWERGAEPELLRLYQEIEQED